MVFVEARVVDGTHLELARTISAPSGSKLLVCVAEAGEIDDERKEWLRVSEASLAGAYGESEPEYDLGMVREVNPEYRG